MCRLCYDFVKWLILGVISLSCRDYLCAKHSPCAGLLSSAFFDRTVATCTVVNTCIYGAGQSGVVFSVDGLPFLQRKLAAY